MTQQHTATADVPDLDALSLAFVVQMQGSWTPQALETLRLQLARQGWTPGADELDAALQRARQQFDTDVAHLFLCRGRPCQQRQKFDASAATLPLQVTPTACQGPCKQAPVATLRVGQRCEMLAQFMRQDDWQAVLDFSGRAAAAGTLLIDPGGAQTFRFDPVHDHEMATGPLQKLQFLLGHFQGDGKFADGTDCCQKEALGSWEANGRFLALRMGVTYPLADGRKDTHTAFAMIGVNPESGDLDARVYTDGGALHDYHLEIEGDAVMFRDRLEAHHEVQAARARKILSPTPQGFEERLELDRGTGQFETYYRIPMQRTRS